MRPLRDNALSIAFGALFVAALIGQSIVGYLQNGEELSQHDLPPVTFLHFITSSEFVVDVAEMW